MENITPQQKRKLEKILRLGENGLPALLEYIFELEEMIQERNDVDMKIIKASVTNILKDMKGDKGDSYVLTDKDKEDISYAIRGLFDDSEIAKRAMSMIDQKSIVKQVVSEIVIPKPKDGNTPDNNHLTNLIKPLIPKINTQAIEDNAVQKAIAELKPLIPSVPTFIDVRNAFEVFSDEEKLKMSAIYKLEETIDEIKKNVENSYTRVISNNRNLSNLLDVNLSGLAVNQSIKWDGVQWIPYTPGSGGGAVDSVNGLTGVVQIDLQSVTTIGATTTIQSTFSGGILTNLIKATSSAGVLIEASNATDVGLLGVGNTANVAWYGSHSFTGNILTAGGTASAPSHTFIDDPDTGMYSAGANILGLATAGVLRVVVNASGNVGIATTGSVLSNAKFSINTNTDKNFIMVGTNGSPELASINDAYNAYQELRINGSPLLLNNASAGNIQMVVGGGSVGIGTTSIGARLQVNTISTSGIGLIVRVQTSQTADSIQIHDGAGAVMSRFSANGSLGIRTSGSMPSGVFFGVGPNVLSDPNLPVQFSSSTSINYIGLNAQTVGSYGALLGHTESEFGGGLILRVISSKNIRFMTDNTSQRMFIESSTGNIGIGAISSFGGGTLVVGIANATAVPTANPTGGGVLYSDAGALKWRGPGGTTTTIAVS